MIKRFVATVITVLALAATAQGTASAAPVPAGPAPVSLHTVALAETAANKLKSSWSWYIARSSGIIAALLLVLLTLSGIGLLTGLTYRILEPLPAWAIHRAIGLSFGVLVLVHIFVLLFDKFVGFTLWDLLVPFLSDYKPLQLGGLNLGSLYMALGILAFYAIIIVIITSLIWMQSKPKPWHKLHYLSYFILAAVFIHGLFMGTDLKHGLVRTLWIAGAFILAVSIISRLRRAHTIGDK